MNHTTITQEVFELVLARPVRVDGGDHPSLTELWWRAPEQGHRLVQVYVDERLIAVSADTAQRRLWVHIDRGQSGARRVELLAVPCGEPDTSREHPRLLRGWPAVTRAGATLAVERDESLPLDTQVRFAIDGESLATQALWPPHAHRGGFGAVFGEGGFGHDAATGPGLGIGELGVGPLGTGGATSRLQLRLHPGPHSLGGTRHTRDGFTMLADQTRTVAAIPDPAHAMTIDPDFTLRWQVAGDPEAT